MALTVRRRGGDNGLSAWPGYVDALSTLLMVIIFVLLVFVLAQAFLSVVLSGRNKQLDRVNQQLAEVSDMLSLERGHSANLQQSISQLNTELSATSAARDTLSKQLAALKSQAESTAADRDSLRADRDRLAQQLADAEQQARANAARTDQLQQQLTTANQSTDAAKQETTAVATQLGDARRELADKQARLAELQRQMADLNKTVRADKETIETKLSDLAKLAEQNRALLALRDDLEKQAEDAAARAMTDEQRRAAVEAQLGDERKLGDSARAQVALLNRQVDELKAQLTSVAKALDLAKSQGAQKDTQIANLGQKLNVALAARVEELQRYRSEFFGKLRDVLANRPGIQVVGDRFVFQSEVLYPVGSADLTSVGQNEITALAVTIKDIATEIPPDIHWILRVDGHTDRQPIKNGGQFASNWELSAARAITVVKLLIADGVPADHLAATGFADNQPLDPGDTPDAFAKNRRIELRLTDR
jgi:chemotaxis protein MotB